MFRKSTRCGSSACVEVDIDSPARMVHVRRKSGPVTSSPISYSFDEWDVFVKGVKNGEFDLPT